MIEIKLKLYTVLKKYMPEDLPSGMLSVQQNSKVIDVIEQLKIPDDLPQIILINGMQGEPESVLEDGDELRIFPPISGG